MANIIVIDNDQKTMHEIIGYLKELDANHHVRQFNRAEEFLERYLNPSLSEEPGNDKEMLRLPYIDLIIFHSNSIDSHPKSWIKETTQALRKIGLHPKEGELGFVLIKFEDDGIETLDIIHPNLCDCLSLPLDRLLFLQKLEIILNLPELTSPSFLFSQNIVIDIEISKVSQIEKISELGVAVRNPIPLKEGVAAHLHFKVPETSPYGGQILDVFARVFHCEKHPEARGIYLVYFGFFGIEKELTAKIRAIADRVPGYGFLIDVDAENFKFDSRNVFISEEDKRIRKVAILDVDEAQAYNIASSLEQEIGNIQVYISNSYYKFALEHYKQESAKSLVSIAKPADFPPQALLWKIKIDTWELSSPPLGIKPTEKVIGYMMQDLFISPENWRKPFLAEHHEFLLNEALRAADLESRLHN